MRKFKSGFTVNSEPIVIKRTHEALGISTGRRVFTDSPFERDLLKLIFFWNRRDDGMSEEEIQERWNMSPWSDKDAVQTDAQ